MDSRPSVLLTPQEAIYMANKLLTDATFATCPALRSAFCAKIDEIFLSISDKSQLALQSPQDIEWQALEKEISSIHTEKRKLLACLEDIEMIEGDQSSSTLRRRFNHDGDTNKRRKRDGQQRTEPRDDYSAVNKPHGRPSHFHRVPPLQRMKDLRFQDPEDSIYVPLLASSTPSTVESDLLDRVRDFLLSDDLVMLVQGTPGSGKSTFSRQLERQLWSDLGDHQQYLPLHINLPLAFVNNPGNHLIESILRQHLYNFSEDEIQQLKSEQQFVLICDGYDEVQPKSNLYRTNQLNEPGQWRAKMVICCRTEYLGNNFRHYFQPTSPNHHNDQDLFREVFIAPFSYSQINDYIAQYVNLKPTPWTAHGYQTKLANIQDLMDLVKNPFLLSMTLDILPKIDKSNGEHQPTPIDHHYLYKVFIEQWIEIGQRRAQASDLPPEMRQGFNLLCDEDFKMCATTFLFDLAGAIFENQQGNPVVYYSHATDSTSWKSAFFGPDYSSQFLRDACPLIRSGNTHQFKHRSLLEYLYAVTVYDLINNASFPLLPNFVNHPLSRISLSDHQMTTKLLADRVPQDASFKDRLIAMLEESKTFSAANMAASNAITILVKSGMRFN
ncbi:hypothetical protein BGX29_012043, partial [Mortierella sp. GBA35]